MSARPIPQAALILALGNIGSRVLGLAREQVIAALFGATALTDAFRVSFRVPLALYDLLIGGMISSALVPVLSGYLAAGQRRELGATLSTLINLLFLALIGIVLLLIAGAPLLVRLLAAGYPSEVRSLSVDLVRLVVPSLVFMGISAILTATLYAQQRFPLPAIAVMSYNAGIVAIALVLHRHFGIFSLALGVLVGAGFQMALQLPALRGLGYRLWLDVRHPGVRQVARLYFPVALGLVVSTFAIAIDTNLASRTGEGSLAAMGFATTLVQFPLGLVAAAVSSAILPSLSRHAQGLGDGSLGGSTSQAQDALQGSPAPGGVSSEVPFVPVPVPLGAEAAWADEASQAAYKSVLALGLRLVLVTIIPATLGLLVLRGPLVRLLFQRGAFDAVAAGRTSLAFLAYSPGLPAAAIDQVLIFGYYARRNTTTPVLVGVLGVGVYLAVGLALLKPLGMPGLALANSAQWVAHMVVMAFLTHRSTGGLPGLASTLLRVLLASGVMAGMLLLSLALMPVGSLASTAALGAFLAALLLVGGLTYLAVLALIGRNELNLLASAFRGRFRPEG